MKAVTRARPRSCDSAQDDKPHHPVILREHSLADPLRGSNDSPLVMLHEQSDLQDDKPHHSVILRERSESQDPPKEPVSKKRRKRHL